MLSEVWKHERSLALAAAALFALSLFLVGGMIFDDTMILGVNRWLKPFKFSISIAIYLVTLAFYLIAIEGEKRAKSLIRNGAIMMMAGEIFFITMQAFRGVLSHYNNANLFDGMIFAAMGVMIFINTLLIVYLFVVLLRARATVSPAILYGLQLGAALMIAASVQGGYLASHSSHAVGVPDGGPGLPFVNWSTQGGDLRIAHFIGLHSFQALPLFALIAEKFAGSLSRPLTTVFGVLYFVVFAATFVNALLGRPLW